MKIFLETPRLILRQFTEADLDNLVVLDSDPDVMRYINGGVASSHDAISQNFLPYAMSYYERYEHLGFWAIVEQGSNEFIGWIFLRPEVDFELLQQLNLAEEDAIELGYRIRQQSWGKGYTTEAARALIEKSFSESAIAKIVAWALVENKASTRVMEKAGLKLERENLITADRLPNNLLSNPLVENLLDRTLVRYQLAKTARKLASDNL